MPLLIYPKLAASSWLVSFSGREGVEVFVGYNRDGGMVAAKRCIRRTSLSLPQIIGPVNKSNLVKLLVCRRKIFRSSL